MMPIVTESKMSMEVKLLDIEQYDDRWPPENAKRFLEWLQDLIAAAPSQFQNEVTIKISSTSSYDNTSASILTISYDRPETKEEAEARIAAELDRVEHRKAWLKRQLQDLGDT